MLKVEEQDLVLSTTESIESILPHWRNFLCEQVENVLQ